MYYFGRSMTFIGASGIIMSIALMAYGREELVHGEPENSIYSMETENLVKPDFLEALLDVR